MSVISGRRSQTKRIPEVEAMYAALRNNLCIEQPVFNTNSHEAWVVTEIIRSKIKVAERFPSFTGP